MNYAEWETTTRSVVNLFLDPENPRIPPSPKPLTETALIEELVAHDDVYELAKNIAVNGFFPSEPLVAIKEDTRLVVVEGNRRLAACKLLVSPETAPPDFKARFRTLAGGFEQSSVKAVPVVIAPSRESTTPLIIARHTSPQILSWEPAMRGAFYHRLVKQGLSLEEVAEKFNLTVSEIKSTLRDYYLYQVASTLNLPPEAAEVVRNPREFRLTTLGRIFEAPVGRQFFGVRFSDDGELEGHIDPDEFRKGFARAVADIAAGKVDSRDLNSPSDIERYLNGFSAAEKPDPTKTGHFNSATFMAQGAGKPILRKRKSRKRMASPRRSRGLIPPEIPCGIKNARVQNLFVELRQLDPARFPNACALAFRCFLEVSVYCFMEGGGEIAKMRSEAEAAIARQNANLPPHKQERSLPPHWTPTLKQMLKRISDPKHNILTQGHVTKALGKVIQDEQELFSFNLFAHNPTYHPTETKLRASWRSFEEFLRIILVSQ